MTTPKVSTIHRGGSRLYVHPDTAEKVPGVTSVLNMLPKGFLKFWASKVVAETAVENLGEIVGIAMRDPQGAIDFLKRAPDRNTGKAADMGTLVHDMYETLAGGGDFRVTPELKPFAQIFDTFVDKFEPEFRILEGTVWSETYGYAGSFDFIADVTDSDGDRLTAIGDWKTTRSGVHEEVSLQMAAYAHADYIIEPDGTRVDIPELNAGIVVHARPEGGQVVPARIDSEPFEVFQHLLAIYHYEREGKKQVLGAATPLPLPESKKGSRR